jgi:hypothetical protein
MIGCRVEVEAKRAPEPERLTVVFHFKIQQIDNDLVNGYVIT